MKESFWENFLDRTEKLINFLGPRIIYAVIFFVVGYIIIRLLLKFIIKLMKKSKMESSVRSFLSSFGAVVLYSILLYGTGRILGIQASAFLTVFGAAGIAIGLALQGSLANFAGGLLILIFKPFKIGDEVEINGIQGLVHDINILYTKIDDWRGEHYTIPNGKVSNEMVKNNSAEPNRRIEIELHFSLEEDIDKLRDIIIASMKKQPGALQDHPFQFWFKGFENYYLKTSARCWSKTDDFWGVYWGAMEIIKKDLAKNDIQLQVPLQEIRQPDLRRKVKEEKTDEKK